MMNIQCTMGKSVFCPKYLSIVARGFKFNIDMAAQYLKAVDQFIKIVAEYVTMVAQYVNMI